MAGKKMRSRKSNSHNVGYTRYVSEGRQRKNKDLKQRRHGRLLGKQEAGKTARLELLSKVKEELGLTSYLINRLLGTSNTSRLQQLLDDTIFKAEWFLNKLPTKGLKKLVKGTKLVRYVESMGKNLKVASR